MRIPETTGPRPRTTRPESRASIAPCIRWPPLVARASPRGRVRRNRAAGALFKKRALVIGREKAAVGSEEPRRLPGLPPFRVGSDQGAGPFQVVDAERDLGMPAHSAEMNRADDIDSCVAEFSGEGCEGPGLVVEPHDEDGPHRAGVAAFHDRLPRLHRLIHNQAHIRSPARGFSADRVDVDSRLSENRGEFRELPGPVRDLHVDLDHVPSGRTWQCEATSVARRRVAADGLWDAEFSSVRLRCDTHSRMSGFKSATWSVPSHSTAMS